MEVSSEKVGAVTVVAPQGKLDAATAPDFDAKLRAAVASDASPVVLDLSGLEYVSSAGLRAVLAAAKRSASANGKMALSGLRPEVQKVFEVSGFSAMLSIHASREDALAAVG